MAGETSVNKATLYSAFKDSPDVAQKLLDIAAANPDFDLTGLVRRIGHPKMGEQFRELVKTKIEAGATAKDLGSEGLWAEFQVRKQFGRTPELADKLVMLGKDDPAGLQDLLKDPGADAPKPRGPRTNGPPVRDPAAKALSFAYKDMLGALIPQATSLSQLQAVARAVKGGKFEAAFKAALPIRPADDGDWTHTQLLMSGVAQQSADILPKQQRQQQDGNGRDSGQGRGPNGPVEQPKAPEPQPDVEHIPDDPEPAKRPVPPNVDITAPGADFPEQTGGYYPEQGGGLYPDSTLPPAAPERPPVFDDQFEQGFVARTVSKGAAPPVPGSAESSIGGPSSSIGDLTGKRGVADVKAATPIDDTGVIVPPIGTGLKGAGTSDAMAKLGTDTAKVDAVPHDPTKDLLNPAGGIRMTDETGRPAWAGDEPTTVDQKVLARRAEKAARKAAKRQERGRNNRDDWE